jgi:nucleotide-binding universal stress UspA family protein
MSDPLIGLEDADAWPRYEPSRCDHVLVAVDGDPASYDALEWAAVEASSRGRALRIVHMCPWPLDTDGVGFAYWNGSALNAATEILDAALRHVQVVTPELEVNVDLTVGRSLMDLLALSANTSMIVLGRSPRRIRRWRAPLPVRLARRATVPVVVAGLNGREASGYGSGQVVLALDGPGAHTRAILTAFDAAQRRGSALLVLRPRRPECSTQPDVSTERSLLKWRSRFRDVPVQQRLVPAPFVAAVIDAGTGASLVVVAEPTNGLLRRSLAHESEWLAASALLAGLSGPVGYIPLDATGRRSGARTFKRFRGPRWS